MKISIISRPRMHFTESHEWIDYNGSVGFVGISAHRLRGVKDILKIKWHIIKGKIEKGTLMAELHTADDQVIPMHAPVSCKFLGRNEQLTENPNLVIESPQDRGWVFFISPLKFNTQAPLLTPEAYHKLNRTNKVAG